MPDDPDSRRGTPTQALTPDVVMDALASVGLFGDGRQMPLNSYENRVYQLYLDDGSAVVAKFYRPDRWSEAQILEEHAFSRELTLAEVPVVAPLALRGSTLHHFGGFAFSVSPRRGGRSPNWTTRMYLSGLVGSWHDCTRWDRQRLLWPDRPWIWRALATAPERGCWRTTCCRSMFSRRGSGPRRLHLN